MPKNDYSSWSKEDLIKKIKALEKRKKYGLVWDSEREPEKVVLDCQKELPIIKEVKENEIRSGDDDINHILIEGDNYHALSVLNYTHEKAIDVIYIDPPYNTGAKDWKYNNNYVDTNDAYRHSKWLSMISQRLLVAKRLLKSDGVLITTADDYELANITKLLEDLGAKNLGRVSVCIKPEGRRQSKYIMEAHEYILFCSWGKPTMRGLNVDFGLDFPEQDDVSRFRWEGFMRRDAGREDRGSDYWYPLYAFNNGAVAIERSSEALEVWPINTKGIERVWLWDKERAKENIAELKATIRKDKATIYYKRRRQGRIKPTSFWFGSKYNANAYGTRLLKEILPETDFEYPKSLYSVLDSIDLFLPKGGIVLDFFAGSGTTGHAVLALNSDDHGKRKFILCTNNENNICTEVTYPRISRVIQGYKNSKGEKIVGLGGNLRYYRTGFVPAAPTDKNKETLTKQSIEMLTLKEGTFDKVTERPEYVIYRNSDKYTGIIFDQLSFTKFKKEISKVNKPVSLYIFSLADEDFSNDFADMRGLIKICAIPESILRVYRRIFR